MKLPWRSAAQTSGPAFSHKRLVFLLSVALALWTVLVFSRLLQAGFINYDDPVYVTENLRVQAGVTWENARWAFTTLYFGFYYPLTWLSHMLDCDLYGLWAGGHHLTSVLLHAGSAVVLLLALFRMTGALWRSAFVAALFALHPLHVESVAWISERKDVLSTFFLMLMLLAYAWYAQSPSVRRYLPVALFFLLGLMAKSMIVTAPVLLLLLDAWPLGRWAGGGAEVAGRERRSTLCLVLEKIPLFALSAVFVALTWLGQRGAMSVPGSLPLKTRLLNAVASCGFYLRKAAWPSDLAFFYPMESRSGLVLGTLIGLSLLVLGSVLALKLAKGHPYLPAGWLWYMAVLFPVIGLVQVGAQARADRYTYVALEGIFIMLSWGLGEWAASGGRRLAVAGLVAGTALCGLSAWARVETKRWHDSETLYRSALDVDTSNAVALTMLGQTLAERGDRKTASLYFAEAVRADPGSPQSWGNLGNFLAMEGRLDEAIACYDRIVRLNPHDGQAWYNRGLALQRMGRRDEAFASYGEAISDSPRLLGAHLQMAKILLEEGRMEAARTHLKRALELAPGSREAQMLLEAAPRRTP